MTASIVLNLATILLEPNHPPCYQIRKIPVIFSDRISVSALNPACELDIEAGECRGTIESYGYNKDDGMCIPFTYGGCGGNENRFGKLEECEKACEDSTNR
ncbi:Kunitz/Bovine pancreatic trypsin inhibitor domain protein [Cooperia oncophora]